MPPFYFLTFAKVSVSVSKKFGLKKVSVSVSKTFGLEKSLGIGLENIWSRKKVSVSVSKIFRLEKKSRSRSRKFWSRKKVSVSVSMKFFGLVTQCGPTDLPDFGLIVARYTCVPKNVTYLRSLAANLASKGIVPPEHYSSF